MARNGNAVNYSYTRAHVYRELRGIDALRHFSGLELRRAIRLHFRGCLVYVARLGVKYNQRNRFFRAAHGPTTSGPEADEWHGGPVVFYRFADWSAWSIIAESRLPIRCFECHWPVEFTFGWKRTPADQIVCHECAEDVAIALEYFQEGIGAARSTWTELMAAIREKETEHANHCPNIQNRDDRRSARRIAA